MLGLTPAAATLPLFLPQAPPDKVAGLFHAATLLAQLLGQGRALDSRALRSAMEAAFGGSDAEGAWIWKDAYEALEAAQVLFLRKFGSAMRTRAGSPAAMLEMLTRLAERLASQTRRSEESEHFQQFSTPIALGFVAAEAAALTPADLVLEPSAGTGLLAIFAELAKARLALNEIAETRAGLLGRLFRDVAVTRHNAEQIHDHLDAALRPSVVLMNPPFSASPKVEGRFAEAAIRHIGSALARLAEGGRLVAITGHNVGPDQPAWREAFVRLQQKGRVVFTAALAGRAYVRHGTTIETRLTVIDRVPAEDPHAFPSSAGMAADTAELLDRVIRLVPPRPPVTGASPLPAPAVFPAALRVLFRGRQLRRRSSPSSTARRPTPEFAELAYETCEWTPADSARLTASLYEGYALQSIRIRGARPHPTKLVQSAAMAAVAPPRPSYRPYLPPRLLSAGILSDAQLESVIYAGEAHAGHLAGFYTVDETYDLVSAAPADATNAVRFRRGWFLGDGTGAGKGRQVAAIILDNWLRPAPGKTGAAAGSVDLQIRQTDRGRRARLDRDRRLPLRHRPAFALPPGCGDRARRRHPLHHLRDAAHSGAKATNRAAFSRSSTGSAVHLTASSCSTKRMRWRTPRATRANAAKRNRRNRARPGCACKTHCTMHASSTSRRLAPRRCRTSPMRLGSGCGAPVTFRSRRAPISCRQWKAAASPRWKCWPAI